VPVDDRRHARGRRPDQVVQHALHIGTYRGGEFVTPDPWRLVARDALPHERDHSLAELFRLRPQGLPDLCRVHKTCHPIFASGTVVSFPMPPQDTGYTFSVAGFPVGGGLVTDQQASSTVVSDGHNLDDYAAEAVPLAKRKTAFQMAAVAMGWAISVSAFLVGGVVGGGLRFGSAVGAIVVGNVILAVIASLIGLIGYRTGLTSYRIARNVFGSAGSVLVSIVLGVLAMGFIGVLMDAFGNALTALVSGVNWTTVVILFTVAVTITALFGFRGLSAISRIAAPALVLLALLGLWRIGTSEGGFAAAVNATPAQAIPFDVGISAVIATWVTGAALMSDVARYARRGRDVVVAVTLGFVGGAGFFEFTAMISSVAVGTPDFVAAMSGLGLLLPAAIVLILALWTTTDNNLYSASLAFTSASEVLGRKVAKPVWTFVSVAIALGVAFLGFASNFLSFLLIVAVVTPPFAGVVIAHFWVLGHIRKLDDAQAGAVPTVRPLALLSWVGTSVVAHYVTLPVEPLAALVIGGAAYSVLALAFGHRLVPALAAEQQKTA
jgi:cytosine permease